MLKNNQKELILLEDLGYLYPTPTSKQKTKYAMYKCFCGNEFKAQVQNIKNKTTKGCGCMQGKNRITHNLTNHRIYPVWNAIIARCKNPKHKQYKDYGGRGITVCEHWLNPQNFINDMYETYKEGLSIDRIENDKGYCKDNCRWVERKIQNRNTRKIYSSNKSGFRGVCLDKKSNKWLVQIGVNYKHIHLGYFDTALEGALVYDKYILDNNLEHTKNF